MTASSFDEALKRVLVHEDGYSNVKTDTGGPTKYGIRTARWPLRAA